MARSVLPLINLCWLSPVSFFPITCPKMCLKRIPSLTILEIEVRPTGPYFSRFCFCHVLKMGAKIAFLHLSETFFSLRDVLKLMENDLEGISACSLSTFKCCPSGARHRLMSCKPSLTQPPFPSGSFSPSWALSLTRKACQTLSVRTEAKKAVNTSVLSVHCHKITHSATFTLFPCLAFYYQHSNRSSWCPWCPPNFSWFWLCWNHCRYKK